LDPSESPAALINWLARQMTNLLGQLFEPYGVTTSQWKILVLLRKREGLSQVEIQEELGVEGATVSGLVQRMIRLDLLERRPDIDDKRVLRVFLTERGRSLERALTPLAQEVVDRAFKGFSDDEKEFFTRLAKRALRNLE
jgi:DNA-binding MarR family transcriptional regulator